MLNNDLEGSEVTPPNQTIKKDVLPHTHINSQAPPSAQRALAHTHTHTGKLSNQPQQMTAEEIRSGETIRNGQIQKKEAWEWSQRGGGARDQTPSSRGSVGARQGHEDS